MNNNQRNDAPLAIWVWIVAILTGWIGVIVAVVHYFINKNKAPQKAKQALILTIICVICTILLNILMDNNNLDSTESEATTSTQYHEIEEADQTEEVSVQETKILMNMGEYIEYRNNAYQEAIETYNNAIAQFRDSGNAVALAGGCNRITILLSEIKSYNNKYISLARQIPDNTSIINEAHQQMNEIESHLNKLTYILSNP